MHYEDPLRFPLHGAEPFHQACPVYVRGKTVDVPDLGPDRDLDAHHLHHLRPFEHKPSKGPFGLVADHQDGVLRVPEVVLEVELNPPGRAHAVTRDHYAWL